LWGPELLRLSFKREERREGESLLKWGVVELDGGTAVTGRLAGHAA
jgi:hypothetical protein